MNGPQHYAMAEKLLDLADDHDEEGTALAADAFRSAALVHATLALVAATAMSAPVDGAEPGMGSPEYAAWYEAAGVKPETEATR